MFFGPKLPVSTFEKVSLEMDFQRLLDCFGIANLRERETFLPNDPSLALRSVKEEADVEELKSRIAAIFRVDDSLLGIRFFDDEDSGANPSIQDEDGQFVAHIPSSMLREKVRVASHLATGFAMCICFSDEYKSLEMHSELVALWYGFGPITAEASVMTSKYNMDGYDHWSISKHGWLSAIQLGYVMAVREFLLGNLLPDWNKLLVIDAKDSLIKGLKYLNKTGDCLVDDSRSCLQWKENQVDEALRSKFASHRLAALEYFPANNERLNDRENEAMLVATNDKDEHVREGAYRLLEFAPSTTPEVVRAIEIGLDDREVAIQIASIRASSIHGEPLGGLQYFLCKALESGNQEMRVQAATSLAANGLCDDKVLRLLLGELQNCLVRGTEDPMSLISVLGYVHDNPKQLVMEYFEHDEDLRFSVQNLFDD